ncbi:MAG: 50S ribosomal protein L17 [Candidatus Glassbacteria bacterium RBG_16_58_8]|uniref:Large ribosomal subunit protein bL17 n=1 Tax=Candidatus Glassbacteria bacterium RBG_16_58_8 TaxID=1817866 RepID=A0A1F5YCE5_9BACT|nr:MAG: 50S ribosomal protein L17 [Candidatus Glassbacteria bacterium RBG_16_58_8]
MRHRKGVIKLSRPEDHRKALIRNLISQLLTHERVMTTEAKAKAIRPFAERLITVAKEDTVHSRRRVARMLSDRNVVKKLFSDIAPRFRNRTGGYTRIMKLSNREGDNARRSIIELVERVSVPKLTPPREKGKEAGGDVAGVSSGSGKVKVGKK